MNCAWSQAVLLFDGDCAEAMQFYADCFGGKLTLTCLGDTPMKAGFPEAMHGKVTFAHLKVGVLEISGTDWLHPVRQPERETLMKGYSRRESRTGEWAATA